eukprot:6990135-Pyramimonas_sp.AAC.1
MKRAIEKCDVCGAAQHPKSAPPARLPMPGCCEFNRAIGEDLLFAVRTWGGKDMPNIETAP